MTAKSKKSDSKSLSTFLEGGAGNLPALNKTEMLQGLQHGTEGTSGPGDVQFLNFSGKRGTYAMGQGRDDIDEDAMFVVWPEGNRRGWVCWKGSKPVARVGWSVFQPDQEVRFDDLEDMGPYKKDGEGWAAERVFVAKALTGEQIAFSTTSKSGNNAVADLWKKISDELVAGDPHLPIIKFDSEEFTAQDQTNFKPVFEIVGWVTTEAVMSFFEGDLSEDDLIAGKSAKKRATKKKAASKKKK